MNRNLSFVRAAGGLLVVTASFIPRPIHALETYTSPRDADVSTAGARSIQIEAGAGLLKVEGRSGIDRVRVRGTAKSDRRSDLSDIKLIAERRGDVVFVKADIPHDRIGLLDLLKGDIGRRELDLVIEVPISLPLEVVDGSGDAELVNTGALTMTDGSGELTIRGVHGDVRVTDGSGGINIDGVEGNVSVRDGSGDIRGSNVTGDFVVVGDGSGEITVSGVGGTMRVAHDGSGNITVKRVAGDFVVDHDGSGLISYDNVKGTVRIPDRKRRRG